MANIAILITSQHYLNEDIVSEKIVAEDFEVLVSPVFTLDGEEYRVILDGNHSFAASLDAGIEAVFIEADATDHDAIGVLQAGDIDAFLHLLWMDGDYMNAVTRQYVW